MHLLSTEISRTFFAYYFADAPKHLSHVLFSRYSRKSLKMSARKCTSLNLPLIGSLGPKDKMSSTNFWSSPPSVFTALLWEQFSSGPSCLFDSLSSLPFSLFWTITQWFLILRLRMLIKDSINSCLTFSLNLLLSVSNLSLRTLRPFFAWFVSCFKILNEKLCIACSEKTSCLGARNCRFLK